jgi:hypothetical protein
LRQGELLLAPKKQGASRFKVVDRGLGRVALGMGNRFVSVQSPQQVVMRAGRPGDAETFQWIETPTGELVLMSLSTNRFMRIDPGTGLISADSPGPKSDDSDGDRFDLSIGFSASALRPN